MIYFEKLDEGWREFFLNEINKPYMIHLKKTLLEEKEKKNIVYPPEALIFNAFYQTPLDSVKVVIIGQDPYHGPNQSHGLAFSVNNGVSIPPSLRNIYKEVVSDVGIKMPTTGCLIPWAKQGVLLLNSVLTVRKNEPGSHFGLGWEIFMDNVIKLLSIKDSTCVFLLWGKNAQKKCETVLDRDKNIKHLVLKAAHPSFFSAAKFFGCCHFSKTNSFLIQNNEKPIDWQIE